MGTRELNIIAKARTTLNDKSLTSPRWTTERLMELLSEGQDDMCRNIPLISRKATINTASGVDEYNLPDDSIRLITARSDGTSLPLTSYDEIERDNADWEADIASSFSSIVVNAVSQQVIRPYPMLGVGSESKPIKVRYQAMPIILGWDVDTLDSEEELSINSMWDFGLKQYIIGMAFLDYADAASISRSQVALSLYAKEYARAERLAIRSFSKRSPTTGYQAKVASSSYHRGDRYGSRNSRFRY